MESSRSAESNIRVYSRFRPLNPREISECTKPVHRKLSQTNVAIRTQKEGEELSFTFDGVLDVNATQQQVYEIAGRSVVTSLFDGFNGTIFAYGQTSSGKTYTMQGPSVSDALEKRGIIPRAVDQIFSMIEESPCNVHFTIKISVVEIYLESIRDLLEPGNLNLKIRQQPKRGTFIEGVTEIYVTSREELMGYYADAAANRATLATRENERSSRSHFVMTIAVAQEDTHQNTVKQGKLFLVDLAGSEKTSKSGVEGRALQEANKINSSLTSLGKVIKALADSRQRFVPYRESKLTRILQESLGGNSKTILIVTCSPFFGNLAETLSTMRFGVSTRKIRNRPIINRQLTLTELQALLDKTRNESLEKSRKIEMLESFIRRELGEVPEIGLQSSTCGSCYIGRGTSSPEFADLQIQSPAKSEVYDINSEMDSCTRYGDSENDGYLTGRSDTSLINSQYETCSTTNQAVNISPYRKTQQPPRNVKLLCLNISCSNVEEPVVESEEQGKPLTERTPRWVGMENPHQGHTLPEKTQSRYNEDIVPVVNFYNGRDMQRRISCPWFRNTTSDPNSLETSFCAAEEDKPYEIREGQVENPEGYDNLPTSRPDYNQWQCASPATPTSIRNNTILEESLDDSELRQANLTWQQRSDLFRKRVTDKQQQSLRLAQEFELLRQQRQLLRDRFRKVVCGGGTGNTPRNRQ